MAIFGRLTTLMAPRFARNSPDVVIPVFAARAMSVVGRILRAGLVAAAFSTTVASAQGAGEEVGKVAYLRDCAGCHGDTGLGDGPNAPILTSPPADLRRSGVLNAYGDEALRARIREGKALALELRPEALRKHARETEALYDFLKRLPGTDEQKVEAGEDLYLSRCLLCHDRYGHPTTHPIKGVRKAPRDLADPAFQRAVTDRELRVLAGHGRAAMPALVPRLRDDEVGPLVAFIRLLSPGYEVYDRYCEACHGMLGRGGEGPGAPSFAFDANYFATHDKDQILGTMWHMLRDAKPRMPHFDHSLSRADLEAILRYLRSLPPIGPTGTR